MSSTGPSPAHYGGRPPQRRCGGLERGPRSRRSPRWGRSAGDAHGDLANRNGDLTKNGGIINWYIVSI